MSYRKHSKISALSSINFSKYEFLAGENVLLEKDWWQKAARTKRFEFPPLGSELKKQTAIAKYQY